VAKFVHFIPQKSLFPSPAFNHTLTFARSLKGELGIDDANRPADPEAQPA
jgi:hypothetical protein